MTAGATRALTRSTSATPASWGDLLRGVDVVCHQAALVGLGARVADLPSYASHNDLGTAALLAAMHEAGVDRLVLASSMVVYGEGRYACADARRRRRRDPGRARALSAGRFENPCPVCGEPLDWTLVDEDARLDPRSGYAASKVAQEHYAAAWARQAGGRGGGAALPQRLRPAGCRRDTPYSGVAAMFRSSVERGEAPQVFEDGGQMRDFVHVDDVARANVLAMTAVREAAPGTSAAYNVCSGTPVSIREVARSRGRRRPAAGGDRSTTASATCGTSWPRRSGPSATSASRADDRTGGGAGGVPAPTRS